jgi:hypothetical protein
MVRLDGDEDDEEEEADMVEWEDGQPLWVLLVTSRWRIVHVIFLFATQN